MSLNLQKNSKKLYSNQNKSMCVPYLIFLPKAAVFAWRSGKILVGVTFVILVSLLLFFNNVILFLFFLDSF